jgi:hypothetical protein
MKVVIIGCPRSGFRYIARVFQEVGLKVEHERWMKNGIADWRMTPEEMPPDVLVLHQLRHPLDTIGSMQTIAAESWELLGKHTSAREKHDLITRGMRAWLEWNKLAELKAHYSYCIEDIDAQWPVIANMVGLGDCPLPDVRRDLNSRKKKYTLLSWADLEEKDMILSLDIGMYYENGRRMNNANT